MSKVRFVDSNITISPGAGSGGGSSISSSYALSASYADFATSASYAVSASHEIVKEVSSSYADFALSSSHAVTASYALNAGESGIFKQTGSFYATTNDLQVTGSLNVKGAISASGDISGSDLYVRDGRFSRDGGAAQVEIIASEIAGGIIGTHTSDNLLFRRFNIPKFTISQSRNFSHQNLDVQGNVSASNNLFTKQLYVEDQLAIDYSNGIAIGNVTDPIRLINDVTASGAISASGDIIGNSLSTTDGNVYLQGLGSSTYINGGASSINVFAGGAQKMSIGPGLFLNNFNKVQFTDTSITITGNNRFISGSTTSTASFGTYLGDGSQLTGIDTGSAFPFTGDAQITGSLTISGSSSPLISLPNAPTNAIIISGSNDRTRLLIHDSGKNNSPEYTEGAGIKLVGGEGSGVQATLEIAAVGSANGGGNNEQTFIHSNQQLVIQAADNDAGDNVKIVGGDIRYGWKFDAPGTGDVILSFNTNGGSTMSELNMGNGTYIQADASGTYYKVGRSTTDWLNLSSTKATFSANVSSSATSTASFGTYLGDGSQLTNLPTQDPFPFVGDAVITGSLILSGSLLNSGTVSLDNTDSPYTITGTQQFILIDPSGGDITVNMPDAATYPGREIKFKLTQAAGANTVTLQRQGADTIDGATTYTDLDIQYESISTVSDGSTGWFIF